MSLLRGSAPTQSDYTHSLLLLSTNIPPAPPPTPPNTPPQPPQDLFAEYDVDSSGSISLEELAGGLQKQGYTVTPSEVRQLMNRLDTDNTGHVEGDEFVAALIDWWV